MPRSISVIAFPRPAIASVLVLVLWLTPGLGAHEVRAPSEVTRGTALTIQIIPTQPLDGAIIRLTTPETDQQITSAQAFPLTAADGSQRWFAIIGVSSQLAPGNYLLHCLLKDVAGSQTTIIPVEVGDRDFDTENIALQAAATRLRSQPDPRKETESQHLVEILSRFNPQSVYHLDVYHLPVDEGWESAQFGDRRRFLYSTGGSARAVHYGLDLAAPTGTPIRAAGAGRVLLATARIITGNTVVIEHLPGLFGLYFHLHTITVQPEEIVRQGQIIGTVGATGVVTGPHLHWEMRAGLVPVDPKSLLQQPPIVTALQSTIRQSRTIPWAAR